MMNSQLLSLDSKDSLSFEPVSSFTNSFIVSSVADVLRSGPIY